MGLLGENREGGFGMEGQVPITGRKTLRVLPRLEGAKTQGCMEDGSCP